TEPDRSDGNHASTRIGARPLRSHLDDVPDVAPHHLERRVEQRSRGTVLSRRSHPLVGPTAPGYDPTPGAQRQPVEVDCADGSRDGWWVRHGHAQNSMTSSAGGESWRTWSIDSFTWSSSK